MKTFFGASVALAVALAAAHAQGDGRRDECAVYSELAHPELRTLDIQLVNTCSHAVTCRVAWTVTCGKSSHVVRESASIAGSEDRSWVASAATCEGDWGIEADWSCDPSRARGGGR